MDKIASGSIPQLTGSIVAACKELVSVFIKAAVGQRENMSFEFFNQNKLLLFFVIYFFNKLLK
jgi:hypothetical protein